MPQVFMVVLWLLFTIQIFRMMIFSVFTRRRKYVCFATRTHPALEMVSMIAVVIFKHAQLAGMVVQHRWRLMRFGASYFLGWRFGWIAKQIALVQICKMFVEIAWEMPFFGLPVRCMRPFTIGYTCGMPQPRMRVQAVSSAFIAIIVKDVVDLVGPVFCQELYEGKHMAVFIAQLFEAETKMVQMTNC